VAGTPKATSGEMFASASSFFEQQPERHWVENRIVAVVLVFVAGMSRVESDEVFASAPSFVERQAELRWAESRVLTKYVVPGGGMQKMIVYCCAESSVLEACQTMVEREELKLVYRDS